MILKKTHKLVPGDVITGFTEDRIVFNELVVGVVFRPTQELMNVYVVGTRGFNTLIMNSNWSVAVR